MRCAAACVPPSSAACTGPAHRGGRPRPQPGLEVEVEEVDEGELHRAGPPARPGECDRRDQRPSSTTATPAASPPPSGEVWTTPARRRPPAGLAPTWAWSRRSRCSRPSTSTARVEKVLGWAKETPGRARPGAQDPLTEVSRRHRRAAAQTSCCASSWPPSARSWARTPSRRRRRASTAPSRRAERRRAREGPPAVVAKEVDRLERTRRAVARARLDPHLARHACSSCRGASAPTTTSTWAPPARCSTPTTTASTT